MPKEHLFCNEYLVYIFLNRILSTQESEKVKRKPVKSTLILQWGDELMWRYNYYFISRKVASALIKIIILMLQKKPCMKVWLVYSNRLELPLVYIKAFLKTSITWHETFIHNHITQLQFNIEVFGLVPGE